MLGERRRRSPGIDPGAAKPGARQMRCVTLHPMAAGYAGVLFLTARHVGGGGGGLGEGMTACHVAGWCTSSNKQVTP